MACIAERKAKAKGVHTMLTARDHTNNYPTPSLPNRGAPSHTEAQPTFQAKSR